MKLNRDKVYDIMNRYCAGNYNRFGRELGVDPAHIHRFLKTGVGGGKKIIFGVLRFCKEKDLDSNCIFIEE